MHADVLFYVFISIFVSTAIITLLGVANILKIRNGYLKALFSSLILEVIGGVIALYNMELFNHIPESEAVVRDFYESVSQHKYNHAYDLIDENSNFKKNLDLDSFSDGYKNTIGINLLAIAPVSNSNKDNSHEYVVYYYDEFNMLTMPVLNDLMSIRFKNIQLFIDKINTLRAESNSKGFKPDTIDELTIQQITAINNQSKIAWLLKNDSNILKADQLVSEIFTENRVVKAIRSYKITLNKVGGMWYIERFSEQQ